MAKATPEELELHNLLLLKDDTAFSRICEKYLEQTVQIVRQFNYKINLTDSSLIDDTVVDSFFQYREDPQMFNPEKQSLAIYFRMNAEGDLKNAWAKRQRTQKKLVAIKDEDDFGSIAPTNHLINQEADAILQAELMKIFENEIDIKIANLMLSNERKTAAFADILQISDLPFEDQQKGVKRHKDRIKKALDRKLKGKKY